MKVSNEAREAYLKWSALPPRDQKAVLAGEWDNVAGMQVLAAFEKATLERAAAAAFERAVAGGKPRDIFDAIRALGETE